MLGVCLKVATDTDMIMDLLRLSHYMLAAFVAFIGCNLPASLSWQKATMPDSSGL